MFDSIVATNIKRIINEKGIKQYIVANKADIPSRDLSAMLNGRKQILSAHILPLSQALNVQPNDLFEIPKCDGQSGEKMPTTEPEEKE